MLRTFTGLCAIFVSFTSIADESDELNSVLSRLNMDIAEQQYQSALVVAQNNFEKWAGFAEFDFLYAQIALKLGKYDEAIFALERVLFAWPDHIPSFYLLALSYAKQKNYPQSKKILEEILTINTSSEFQVQISELLNIVEQRAEQLSSSYKQQISFILGHDTNVNSGAVDDRVIVSGLVIPLDEESKQTDDSLMRASYSLNALWQSTQFSAWQMQVQLSQQKHKDTERYDRYLGHLNFGHTFTKENIILKANFHFAGLALDDATYQQEGGINALAQYQFYPNWYVALSGKASTIHNAQDKNLDSKVYQIQSSLSHYSQDWFIRTDLTRVWQPADEPSAKHFGRDYNLISTLVAYQVTPSNRFHLKLHKKYIDHREAHPFFKMLREEEEVLLSLGWQFQYSTNWRFDAVVNHYDKQSSIDLYRYDRTEWSIGVNYDF